MAAKDRGPRRPVARKRTLSEAVAHAERVLKAKDRLREQAIRDAREIQRAASTVLRGGVPRTKAALRVAREQLALATAQSRALKRRLEEHPGLYESGLMETPLQELAEAYVLLAHTRGEPIPTFDEIGVTPAAFILGIADAIGEFRRQLVEAIRRGRIPEAERHLEAMEEAFAAISGISLPDAIVPVRKKVDTARALLERSASELALAVRMHEHEQAIRAAMRRRR
jgi:translin